MSEPIRVGGGFSRCPKCGEEYHNSIAHDCVGGAAERPAPEHVCGLAGYDQMRDGPCPAERPAEPPRNRDGIIAGLDQLASEDPYNGLMGDTCRQAAALLRAQVGEPREPPAGLAEIVEACARTVCPYCAAGMSVDYNVDNYYASHCHLGKQWWCKAAEMRRLVLRGAVRAGAPPTEEHQWRADGSGRDYTARERAEQLWQAIEQYRARSEPGNRLVIGDAIEAYAAAIRTGALSGGGPPPTSEGK